ncbi:MAG: hypothetical protein ACI4I1_11810 [Oscillospiraceae bacterium]
MKITAEFDSVNSADLAAANIRRTVSPFSDIKVLQKHNQTSMSFGGLTAAFGNGNPSIGPNMYTYPIPYTANNQNDISESYLQNKVTLEVICRKEDRKKVSGIIINSGGFEISEYN